MRKSTLHFATAVLIALTFISYSGCDIASCGACTDEFRSYTVRVVNSSGDPVEGLTANVRNERTGRSLTRDSTSGDAGAGGIYALISDSEIDLVSEDGDLISFRAFGSGLVAEAFFVIGTTNCRCHVLKISGPDTITAR